MKSASDFEARTYTVDIDGHVYVTFGFALDSQSVAANNDRMVIPARVHNGVVVLEGDSALPEGAAVNVVFLAAANGKTPRERRPVQLRLIPSSRAGNVQLTNEQISEIMDEEDVSPRR